MKTGAKIAIGCGIAAFLAIVAVAVGLVGTAFWAKHKFEEATGGPGAIERMAEAQKEIERYESEANRNSFTHPAGGIIAEPRLIKFLAVRRDVYAVYEQNKAEIEKYRKQDTPDLAAVGKGLQLIHDLRLAQARAQAREGMSDDEYRWLVEQVYKSAWAARIADETGGRTASEAVRESLDAAGEELRRQLENNPDLTEAQRRQILDAHRRMQAGAGQAEEAARATEVPPQNVELFRRHAEAIQKYAMTGLEWIGL